MVARIRTDGEIVDINVYWGRESTIPDAVEYADTAYAVTYGEGQTRYMVDENSDNYQRRRDAGEVILNDMHSIRTEKSTSTGKGTYVYTHDPQGVTTIRSNGYYLLKLSGDVPITFGPLTHHVSTNIDLENLKTLAVTEAYANIKPAEVEGLVAIAEMRETLQLFVNPLGSAEKLFQRYRKAGRKAAKRNPGRYKNYSVVDFIEENWLQYRYGIMPIVYDVSSVIELLSGENSKFLFSPFEIARGYATDSDSQSRTDEASYANTWTDYEKVNTTNRDVKVRAGVLYENNFAPDTFGMQLNNIPRAVWETVPFSFVADWFVNVNDYIAAIAPKYGTKVLGSFQSVVDINVTTAEGRAVGSTYGYNGSYYDFATAETSSEVLRTTEKTRGGGNDYIGIAYNPAPFGGNVGKKRMMDSLSLIDQILGSKLR